MANLWFPQATFRFNDSLERLIELTRNCSIHGYTYYKERITEFSQKKEHRRLS